MRRPELWIISLSAAAIGGGLYAYLTPGSGWLHWVGVGVLGGAISAGTIWLDRKYGTKRKETK